MVIVDPMPEAVEYHLADDGVVTIHRVAATGKVLVAAAAVVQHVIHPVFQPFETEGGAEMISFARVIKHHVQDDLDPRLVQCLHHLLEFDDLGTRRGIRGISAVRRKERHRVITPVIGSREMLPHDVPNGKFMDRHQFHGGDPQGFQVRDLLDQTEVGPRVLDIAGGALCKSTDMCFVNDGFGQIAIQMSVTLPIEVLIDHHAFRGPDDTVVAGLKRTGQRLRIGIDQACSSIEELAGLRIVRSIHLQMVQLPVGHSRDEETPDVAPAIGLRVEGNNLFRFAVVDAIVQQQSHGGGRAAEDNKLHTAIVEERAVR